MTSKVLVKMPEVQFSQVKKTGSADIIQNVSGDPMLRIAQLEQNIRFLQEQHQLMLSGLHREIESIKQKNRDLQLQLTFATSNDSNDNKSPTTETSAEPETKQDGNDPEKCERLEKELAAAKTALETSIARTTALQNLLQHHKIQESQEGLGGQRNAIAESWSGSCSEGEARLQVRLEEAEQLVRRLRAESQHQRRELQSIKASLNASGRGNGGGRGAGQSGPTNNYRGGGVQNMQNVFHKLPPLQQQQQQQQQQSSQQPQHFPGHGQHHQTREYHHWNRSSRKSIDKQDQSNSQSGPSDADLSVSNLQYNNGNNGMNQNHQRRGNNSSYGNNYYYRTNDRGYRSYREGDDGQYKNYNTPAEHSDGENEPVNDTVKTSSYRSKRNHNRYHDKS